ncbi:MAG TPA: type II toxin-antitoxin system VapC family toxin [Longimicrobiaceae bacterium]|nr:type II toxin-antitoxin system VapC family toxin [Longimicrobiaceae bacterium]
MRLLVDTHALLWWLAGNAKLSSPAREAIAAHDAYVSAATAWEVTTKVRIGKLPEATLLASQFSEHIWREGFLALPITVEHAARAGNLVGPHRDPFDRMLIAQAQAEDLILVSNEAVFDSYGVQRVW